MKRTLSIAKTFRPELEALEVRNLLSDASVGQPFAALMQPIQQEVTQLNTQVQKMAADYYVLLGVVAGSPGPGLAGANTQAEIIQDYNTLVLDLENITALSNAIQTTAATYLTYEYDLIHSGTINFNLPQNYTGAVDAYDTLILGSAQASQDQSEALTIAGAPLGNQYPSVYDYIAELH